MGQARAVLMVAVLLLAAGCGRAPAAADSGEADPGLARQARLALDRYERAWAAVAPGFVPVGPVYSQIGDWEPAIAENNKLALESGELRPGGDLREGTPPAGEVRWADGTSVRFPLASAVRALEMLRGAGEGDCGGCVPLQVTGARPRAMTVATSRGTARAPGWEYTLAGSRVRIAVVAVDPGSIVKITPPPWDPDDPPGGLRIDGVVLALDGRTLTARFTGAEESGGTCGAAYTARAVESEHAIVVIVDAHPNAEQASCRAVGHPRTAMLTLATPLAERTVLEVTQGLPVPVERRG